MIKIQTEERNGQFVLHVEGRLAGTFVPELEKSWRQTADAHPQQGIVIDLEGVICVDRAGRQLLQSMHRTGVAFVRARLATQDILEEIMERPECWQ